MFSFMPLCIASGRLQLLRARREFNAGNTTHRYRILNLCLCVCCLQMAARQARANVSPEVEDLVAKMVDVQIADKARLSAIAASGVIDFVMSDGSEMSVWDFDLRQREKNLWLELRHRHNEARTQAQRYDIVRLVGDAEVLVVGLFSPKIHPTGCESQMFADNQQNFSVATYGPRIDPRSCLLPPVMRSAKDLDFYRSTEATVTADPNGAADSVLVTFKSGLYWRVQADAQLEYRIVRAELGESKKPDRPETIFEYRWKHEPTLSRPSEITLQKFDHTTKNGYHIHRMNFTNLVDKLNPETDLDFTVASLKLCERGRVIDHRPGATVAVRNLDPAQLPSREEGDGLAKTIESLPVRYRADLDPVNKPGSSTHWRFVLLANAALLAIALCAWWFWVKRRS